ncbi:hypothetical protein AMAG_13428 [Allomyces macrogynus ATCC 38327]|uniref:Glucosidase 2 subunit beta n=1 Tax=Allomyces macrogynus (strain ATCC 38327) TaxID=578462 RepID=A0A0L0T237_ALLM3|nr:hypothetical protein AMAG_13428 [Allomyces macrogynus ATCC 38327]|eukprot:KNE68787.1 hypothetical protein AMAG_13428 [Allomyces macrogynus ATCC 38327]
MMPAPARSAISCDQPRSDRDADGARTGVRHVAGVSVTAILLVVAALTATTVVAADATSGNVATSLRGVAKSKLDLYKPRADGQWTCLDAPKTIPFAAVNDDYCDCPDGSDEPGTAACNNGWFHCANVGHRPGDIPSSRVNDGVCEPDCCDGSDEYDGKITCPNTCAENGAAWRKQQEEAARKLAEGLRKKEEYRQRATKTKITAEQDLAMVEVKLRALESELAALRAARDTAETDERAAQDRANAEPSSTDSTEAADSTNTATATETPVLESWYDKVKAKIVDLVVPKRTPLDLAKKAADDARQKVWDAEAKQRDLETKKSDLRAELDTDVGAEPAYGALVGQCFTMTTAEYTYELCPFRHAEQRNSAGYGATRLGTWGKWTDDGQWSLTNGQYCWNGPDRSVKVALECGVADALVEIAEPNKCEYTMRFTTPAACVEKGEGKAVEGATHDEL